MYRALGQTTQLPPDPLTTQGFQWIGVKPEDINAHCEMRYEGWDKSEIAACKSYRRIALAAFRDGLIVGAGSIAALGVVAGGIYWVSKR